MVSDCKVNSFNGDHKNNALFFVMLKYYDRCSHNKKWHISPHTLQKTSHKNQNAHFLFHFVSKKLPVTIIIAKFARIYINYEKKHPISNKGNNHKPTARK